MRVAILSGNARPADAIGNQIAEKSAFFLERGARVRVFVEDARVLHPAIADRCQAVKAECLDAGTHEFLAASDLVIAEFGHYHSLIGLLPLCNRLGRRVVVDYHGITPLELWGDLNREPISTALGRRGIVWYADGVLVHSDFAADEIHAATRYPGERTFVLGHPVDADRLRPDGSPGTWRSRLRLAQDDRLLLFVGRIAKSKRIDVLIEALAQLPKQVILAIVGDMTDIYALEAARCRKLAEANGVAGRIRWLGQIPDADLAGLYRTADLFVTASEHEGFCIPVAEALCSGKPVVASRTGAVPDTLGGGGVLFTPGDAMDLARQLERLLFEEPGLIETLSERALAEAGRFAQPRWQEQFGIFVDKILHMAPRTIVERLLVESLCQTQTVSARDKQALMPLRITNAGSHPVELSEISLKSTPARGGSLVEAERSPGNPKRCKCINDSSEFIMPGRSTTVAVVIDVPEQPGMHMVRIQAEIGSRVAATTKSPAECAIKLNVTESAQSLQSALVKLAELCRLPEGAEYETKGRLGRLKSWLKEKLLGGFRRRYVDVLSRQQSEANGLILTAIAEVMASAERDERTAEIEKGVSRESAQFLDRFRKLECRVAELEEANARVMT